MSAPVGPGSGLPDRVLSTRPGARRGLALIAVGILLATLVGPAVTSAQGAARDDVKILSGEPNTLDPAAESDLGSAAISAQIYESLTAFDPELTLRPALASSWDVLDGGQRIVFHLRPGLAFSDGSPITGADVVRSWLRIIDPAHPSPLATLIGDVVGADDYRKGLSSDPAKVGLTARGLDVEVRLIHPGAQFPAIVTSPTFGIVPPGRPDGTIASGGYVVRAITTTEMTLAANEHYWAGRPAIATVHLVTSIGGRSPVDAFSAGDVDYTSVSGYDATWLAYDPDLGSSLRTLATLSTEYLGFDVRQKPFDDVRVRQAFALAVDWARLVRLASIGAEVPATSMVPPGVPGRSAHDFSQHQDKAKAQALLAEAGYPGGTGFPDVTYVSGGVDIDDAIVGQIHDVLGVTIKYETMDFGAYFARLETDPPAIWSLGWVADYPGPNDFLGVLLGTGASNDYGHWSSAEFDAALDEAASTVDPATALAAFERAEAVVQRDVPVIPLENGSGWALARAGLLGASDNGLGFIRLAGLAWKQ